MESFFLPLLYNAAFLGVLLVWLNREQLEKKVQLNNVSLWIISAVVTTISVIINICFVIYDLTDVDNALWTGSKAFVEGVNPYTNEVVEHINTEGEVFDSYYNYGPINLAIYTIFFLTFGPVFGKWWLFPSSLILGIACYFTHAAMRGKAEGMVSISPKQQDSSLSLVWNHNRDIPLFCMLISPFLVNNSILMLLFFLIGRYFRHKNHKTAEVSFYVLGAEVKFMTGLIVVILFLDQMISEEFSWKGLQPYFAGILVYLLSALPFGLYPVIRGEFLHQGVPSERTGEIAGPLLIEILLLLAISDLLIPAALVIMGITYWITIKRSLSDREIILCLISLFVLPFYGTELAIIPFAIILIHYTGIEQ